MAEVKGKNYALMTGIPQEQIPAGEVSGKERVSYDEYTFPANVFALNDIINVGSPIPKGARITEALVLSPSLGATGIFDLGIASDQNYFVDQADAGGQAVAKRLSNEAGLLVKLADKVQPQLKCTEATASAAGLVIQVMIKYVLE